MARSTTVFSHLMGPMALRLGLVAIVLVMVVVPADLAQAFQADVRSQDVSFRSGDVTLRGTVLLPNTAGPNPAMALLAGSGAGPRDKYRLEAEAFAQAGIVTLIYDKRTSGYSTTGSGNRSYAALADDALAAVSLLQHHPDVDPSAVGLWGHSEGGWVAPLAASRSTNVAFVVTVGASAVPAAQQTVWALGNRLRSMGVSGSMVDTFLPATVRVLVSAGAFAEADYDGVDAWQRVQQPVLAIWGAQGNVVPPAESSRAMAQALEGGGNQQHTIRFFPGEHAAHTTPDGFERGDSLAPGYAQTVTSWVHSIAEAPHSRRSSRVRRPRGTVPHRSRRSRHINPQRCR
jgi:pimeloyl-ACP methyl ester carboxylesterase